MAHIYTLEEIPPRVSHAISVRQGDIIADMIARINEINDKEDLIPYDLHTDVECTEIEFVIAEDADPYTVTFIEMLRDFDPWEFVEEDPCPACGALWNHEIEDVGPSVFHFSWSSFGCPHGKDIGCEFLCETCNFTWISERHVRVTKE